MAMLFVAMMTGIALLAGCGQKPADMESVGSVTEKDNTEIQEEDSENSDSTVIASYEELIETYQKAFEEQWDMDQLEQKGLSTLIVYNYDKGIESIGYNPVTDIDHDGQEELLISELAPESDEDNMLVLAAYTLKDDGVHPIFISSERNRFFLLDLLDNPGEAINIVNEGSNSAFNSFHAEKRLENGELILVQAVVYDDTVDADHPWYLTYDQDMNLENAESITEDEANAIIEANKTNYYFPGYADMSQGYFMPDAEYVGP